MGHRCFVEGQVHAGGLALVGGGAPLLGNREGEREMGIEAEVCTLMAVFLRTLVQAFVLPAELSEIIR